MKHTLRLASFLGILVLIVAACATPAPTGGAAATPTEEAAATATEITSTSEMTGTSEMTDTTEMTDTSEMSGTAEMTGTSEMTDTSEMTGTSEMSGTAEMTGTSEMTDTSEMTGTSEMTDTSEMTGTSEMSGTSEAGSGTLAIYESPDLGPILTDEEGMVLYIFDKDEPGKSNCADQCLQKWPPLTVADEDVELMGDGVTGTLGTIERDDGTYQVTINDWPLYYYAEDQNAHDTTGQAVGDVWWVVAPDGSKVTTQ